MAIDDPATDAELVGLLRARIATLEIERNKAEARAAEEQTWRLAAEGKRQAPPSLPPRPWDIHVFQTCGDTVYQVQASDGQVVTQFDDYDFVNPGAAMAAAVFIATAANALDGVRTGVDGAGPGVAMALAAVNKSGGGPAIYAPTSAHNSQSQRNPKPNE